MLLTVVPNKKEMERFQRIMLHMMCFSYFSYSEELLESALNYRPSMILIQVDDFTPKMIDDVKIINEYLPNVRWLVLTHQESEAVPTALASRGAVAHAGIYSKTILYYLFKMAPRHKYSSRGNYNTIIKGLFTDIILQEIYVYGYRLEQLKKHEKYILRFLSEIYPLRVSAETIATYCFRHGKPASKCTVQRHIRRINRLLAEKIPIILIQRDDNNLYQLFS